MSDMMDAQLRKTLNGGSPSDLAAFFGLEPNAAIRNFAAKDWQSLRTVSARGGYTVANRLAGQLARLYGIAKAGEQTPLAPPLPEPFQPMPDLLSPGMDKGQVERIAERIAARLIEEGDFAHADGVSTLRDALRATNAGLTEIVEGLPDMLRDCAAIQVQEALKNLAPTVLTLKRPDAPPVPLGLVHKATGKIISALAAGVHVYLHGPAGSGKTTVASKAAEAFGLALHVAAKVESEYLLLGFTDANGKAVRTPFREAYENGGVFLFDELDGSSPGAIVALNMALANGICPFPDGAIRKHPDFKCIAAGNTVLNGASTQYVGRNQLDAASIDRFVFIEFGYDEALEQAIAPNRNWCLYVQAARAAVLARGLEVLITPRATLDGCKLLASGWSWDDVKPAVLYKGIDADTVEQVERETQRRYKPMPEPIKEFVPDIL